jgi:hypothetical protein
VVVLLAVWYVLHPASGRCATFLHPWNHHVNSPYHHIYKCAQTPGQLFTNCFGGPPDWVLSPKGDGRGPVVIESWTAALTTMDKQEGLAPHAEECSRLPIQEGCLISEYANGQSSDQRPPPEEVD